MLFFVGMPEPAHAAKVRLAFISIKRLLRRKSVFLPPAGGWAMDSGAFTELTTHGRYRHSPMTYARQAAAWVARVPGCRFVTAQDYMCEPFALAATGLTVADHQRLTIERYDALRRAWAKLHPGRSAPCPILPVIQGWTVDDYVRHVKAYGRRLPKGAWVGVGSVCKRQKNPDAVVAILRAILAERPDLRLHGFGVKLTALQDHRVQRLLHSADSMAWSFAARYEGRNGNDPAEAVAYEAKVSAGPSGPDQLELF